MANFFKKLFGTKSDRDLKAINPIIDKINKAYVEISKMTGNQLRTKTVEFKQYIKEQTKKFDDDILSVRSQIDANPDMDTDEKEKLYDKIDSIKKDKAAKIKIVLDELLPEAFAVMKATAALFKDNEQVVVNATQHDIDIAAKQDNVIIDGDKAIYSNSWIAGGNLTKWNMVHYDVQLFGGIVLHQGKIAEMAT